MILSYHLTNRCNNCVQWNDVSITKVFIRYKTDQESQVMIGLSYSKVDVLRRESSDVVTGCESMNKMQKLIFSCGD